ncbi:MAG: sulfatase-like hydrolase/transferase [Planctomycetota bacterium]
MPPNIVFIMTDQQRFDMLGCNDATFVKTPCLDRLAASGVNFKCAYTTTPVCTPARAALFTGLYSTSAGAFTNQQPLADGIPNLGELAQAAGFATGYVGKWHLDGPAGGYYGTGIAPRGFPQAVWYDGKKFQDEVGAAGFKKWHAGKNLNESDCWGTRVADRGCRFIEEHARGERPFFLVVSFDEPHGPSVAPERYYDLYRGTQRPRQPNFDDDLSGKPATHRMLEEFSDHGGRVPAGENPNNSPPYYGCNSYIDAQIGRVVEAVDRCCPENTVIVYTSDHGDHAGAHGLLAKGPTMYEEIVHIPLIIRAPGVTPAGADCHGLISHIDLAPTLFRLAGIPAPAAHGVHGGRELFTFQGCDQSALLADPAAKIRDAVFLEYTRFEMPQHTRWGFLPIRCIRTDRYKLVVNLVDSDELYDLAADPYENVNRIQDASLAAVRNGLHDRLLDWMDRRFDPFRGNCWWQRPWRPEKLMPPQYNPVAAAAAVAATATRAE